MATTPAFIATGSVDIATTSAANTAIDGTGTIVTLATGTTNGKRILEVDVQCAATSAAALVNLFLSTDGGTTWTLFDQVTVAAATSSATVKATRAIATYSNLILPSTSHKLGMASTIAQVTKVIALGGAL